MRQLANRVVERLELLRLDAGVIDRATEVGSHRLRALDAIHLATALTIRRELDAVVTYDQRLGAAVADEGLRVEAPTAS